VTTDAAGNVHRPAGAADGGQFATKSNARPAGLMRAVILVDVPEDWDTEDLAVFADSKFAVDAEDGFATTVSAPNATVYSSLADAVADLRDGHLDAAGHDAVPWTPGAVHPKTGYTTVLDDGAGNIAYVRGTQTHRVDGPAVIAANGDQEWWQNDEPHRTDGPAIERADGTRVWMILGAHHRDDGPAVEKADGTVEWWLDGNRFDTEEEWMQG